MAPNVNPTSPTRHEASFVVALMFNGVRRGLAGPFGAEASAEKWAEDLLESEAGWTWAVDTVCAPGSLPLAHERRAARAAQRRHLRVVR